MTSTGQLLPVNQPAWTTGQRIIFRFVVIYSTLFTGTLSFPHPLVPDIPGFIAPLFESIAGWVGDHLFHINRPYTKELISDSTGLYIHLFVLLVISLAGTIMWSLLAKPGRTYHRLFYWFRSVISYYLAWHLLVYGFNKLFKWQFYLPEPNTLFTTMGNTYRDLLYWSTMGTSHSYNVFLGLTEIIAAILLLFRKTRLIGAMMAFGILINVVMINFSFNISVKVYSCFLLLLSIVIASPDLRRLYHFFFTERAIIAPAYKPAILHEHKRLHRVIKTGIIFYMLTSCLYTYIKTGNYNDDKAIRPIFHGAYDVTLFVRNGDTLPPLLTDRYRWRRLFIHRRGYLIIQSMNDEMQDYQFSIGKPENVWMIRHEGSGEEAQLTFHVINPERIDLRTKAGNDSLYIQLQKIDMNKLPVLQKEFDWTIDP